MNIKKILVSLFAGLVGVTALTVSSMATNTLGNADFDANEGVVFDGTNYYVSLDKALKGVHGNDAILYCKPGADLGTMTHGHVCNDLTVYGNGAYLSGGEQDFEIDNPGASGTSCDGLTGDITIKVDNLSGTGIWGTKKSEYAVNAIFTNCEEMGKVFITGNAGEFNLTMEDCTFVGNDVSNCKVYSNTYGTIILDNVDFSNIDQPVALNNKSTGKQTIVMKDCDFDTCGASTADWTVPVSVKSSVAGGTSELTVENCTFSGTVTNSIGQDADVLLDYGVGTTDAVIKNTAAKVGVETESNNATYTTVEEEKTYVADNNTETVNEPVAKLGEKLYASLALAVENAVAGDVIEVYEGVHDLGTTAVTIDKAITIKGAGNDKTEFVINLNASAFVISSDNVTLKDFAITQTNTGDNASHISVSKGAWDAPAVNYSDITVDSLVFTGGKYGMFVIAEDMIINKCKFTGIDSHNIVIYSVRGKTEITNNFFDKDISSKNRHAILFEGGVSTTLTEEQLANFVAGGTLLISGNTVDSKGTLFVFTNWGLVKDLELIITNNEVRNFDNKVIGIDANDAEKGNEFSKIAVNNNVFILSPEAPERSYIRDSRKYTDVKFNAEYNYYSTDPKGKMNGSAIDYIPYYIDEEMTKAVYPPTETITVEFEEVATVRDERLYNINFIASEEPIINRLNSADLTFILNQISGNNAYEIIDIEGDNIKVNNVEGDRYEFHFETKTDVTNDTSHKITLAQVKISGYGKYSFAVKEVGTNVAHATTLVDNIVDTYIPGGSAENEGKLDIGEGTGEVEIFAPTQKLTINVSFPNSVENNNLAYQKMNVLVTGEDITDISIDLGTDNAGKALELNNKNGAKYTVVFDEANCVYTVVIEKALTANTAYNVTVSGAGYRTARYTVNTQETDKVLNFWNNVKDNAIAIEEGKNTMKTNFLAGDIVKDNNINIYDLSAVVSYFGEINLATTAGAEKYAKYDLNRDGKIDSKDVAYVLVSWNN